ncbi:MAG: hypothetical protein P1U42_05310 [Phycisphaerales bacterium]|nr:hypothetical protein [Phycisphaerales bacterium]
MLCECGQYEATIHEVIITSDKKKVERHLCEKCARKQGINPDPYVPISELMSSSSYIMGQISSSPESPDEPLSQTPPRPPVKSKHPTQTCVGCGQTFGGFKKSGLLGCPACYQIFEDRIGPMIERAHEGGCNHVGKVPKRALCESQLNKDDNRIDALLGNIKQREERLDTLRIRLAKSIHDEEYEQAAMLRDELTRLTSLASSEIEATPNRSANAKDSTAASS